MRPRSRPGSGASSPASRAVRERLAHQRLPRQTARSSAISGAGCTTGWDARIMTRCPPRTASRSPIARPRSRPAITQRGIVPKPYLLTTAAPRNLALCPTARLRSRAETDDHQRGGAWLALGRGNATQGALGTSTDGRGLVWGWVGNNQLKQHDEIGRAHV